MYIIYVCMCVCVCVCVCGLQLTEGDVICFLMGTFPVIPTPSVLKCVCVCVRVGVLLMQVWLSINVKYYFVVKL